MCFKEAKTSHWDWAQQGSGFAAITLCLWGTGGSESWVLISHAVFGYLYSGFIILNSLLQRRQRKGVRFPCYVHWKDVDSELCLLPTWCRLRRNNLIAFWDRWSCLKEVNCFCQEVYDHMVEFSGSWGFSGCASGVCFCVSSQPSPACQLHRQPLEVVILTSAHAGAQSPQECVQQLT